MTKDEFETLDQNKKEILKRLYKTNENILKNIDVRLLDDYYLQTLGEDKISLISCYKQVQSKILGLSSKKYEIFCKCLNNYLNRTQTDEWTTVAYALLFNIDKYDELIQSIDDIDAIDIEKLSKIMQSNNFFGIKSVQDLERFEEIKKQKCDLIMYGRSDIIQKQRAVLQKIFGIDLQYAKSIVDKFGEDIYQIENGDEKEFVISLQKILSCEDETILQQIYDEFETIIQVDKTLMERNLKNSYGKLFNKDLYSPNREARIEDEQLPEELRGHNLEIYDAGIDFKMIITSVGAFKEHKVSTFPEDWNRASIGTQHFSASYIRNDMLGTAAIPYLCYGFLDMKEDALMLSGPKDISSAYGEFAGFAYGDNEKYYTPDTHINKTENYNEMDFRRIQGGVKKQPDYIVVFKRDGKISNNDIIMRAFREWEGKLPIVIIDIDRCLKKESQEVYEMLDAYEETQSLDIAKEILQKVKNNRCTDNEFCTDIQEELDDIEWDLSNQEQNLTMSKVGTQDLQENYSRVSAAERQEMMSVMAIIRRKIEEIVK